MRISPFLYCTLLFIFTAGSATAVSLAPSAPVTIASHIPGTQSFGDAKPHPLRDRKLLYYKGKGTMGLVLTLALGPVGYAGVHIFSHNLAVREKAKKGMAIWLSVAVVTGIVWSCIAAKVSLDDILFFIGESILHSL